MGIATGNGAVTNTRFALTGLSSGYITDADYVAATDTLYAWDVQALYKATEVAQALGLATAVPEPASWVMMMAGVGMAGAVMRRRRAPVAIA